MNLKPNALPPTFTSDLIASLVVFLVALPLCMGIAIASGLPPALGLVTGIVGGIVVGAVSGSPLQVSGPAAGLAVITLEAVNEFGVAILGEMVLIAGMIQFLAGRFKLGQWFRAISPAVVYGMLAGIGILIVAGQFHVMVDDKPKGTGLDNLMAIPASLYKAVFPPDGTYHHHAAAIGLLTFVSILLWNSFKPKSMSVVPGTLVGIVMGTAATAIFGLDIKHVAIPDNFLSVFSMPSVEGLARLMEPKALITVLTLAVIASAETMLSASAVDRMHSGPRTNFDKELSAQGVGNMICGLLGAPAMTGVIVRSSANVQAGAKTRLSAMLHGIWLLAFVLLFPAVLRTIPMAGLAGILVFTGMKLVDLKHLRKLYTYGRMPVVIYLATVIGIVAEDLLTGVLIGLALTVGKLVWKATQLSIREITDCTINRSDLHITGMATFVRLPSLLRTLDRIPGNYEVHLHTQQLYYIDHTCLDMLKATAEQRASQGGCLHVHWEGLTERYTLQHLSPVPQHS